MIYLMLLIWAQLLSTNPSNDICISSEEQKLYEYLNEYRESRGLEKIPFSAALTRVAQAHVRDLENHFDFEPGGKCNPHSWSAEGDWSSCCYTNDHKEASCMWDKPKEISRYDSPGYEIAYFASNGAKAREGLDGWVRSPSHHPLIINSGMWSQVSWNAVGIGIYGKYAVIWFGEMADESTFSRCP